MIKTFVHALTYSCLIELESAYFKGAVATMVYGRLHWWPLILTAVTVVGFAATLVHLVTRLERVREFGEGVIDRRDLPVRSRSAAIVIIAALIALTGSALVHLDETGARAAQRHGAMVGK
jgi:uncharacterized membrane protein